MRNLVVSALKNVLYGEAKDNPFYLEGKRTDKMESIGIKCYAKGGEVQIIIPYEEGMAAKLNSHFAFGEIITVDDVFNVSDIKIAIYKDDLTVKYEAELREDVAL